MTTYFEVLKKYGVFSGRAQRSEYWLFTLVHSLVMFALFFMAGVSGLAILTVLAFGYAVATLIPNFAVTVRRLHDTGRSGWWLLIGLIPYIGGFFVLVFMLIDSQPGKNDYGTSPKYGPIDDRVADDRRRERQERDKARREMAVLTAGVQSREISRLEGEGSAGPTTTCKSCGHEISRHLIACTNCRAPVGYR